MDIFLISKKGLARWDDWDIPYGCSLNLIIARSLPCWQQFGTLLEIWHRFWHSFTSMLTWHFKKKKVKEIENKTADAMPIEQGKIQDLFIYFLFFCLALQFLIHLLWYGIKLKVGFLWSFNQIFALFFFKRKSFVTWKKAIFNFLNNMEFLWKVRQTKF